MIRMSTSHDTNLTCIHKVRAIFAELGISQYLNDFLEQGFDEWETFSYITESDLDALMVKLGHRRKLQRRIAENKDLNAASLQQFASGEDRQHSQHKTIDTREDNKDNHKDDKSASSTHGGKRRYRRHPKPDEHAPERPLSAYILFSSKMREDLKGRHLSFTESAKLIGETWRNLPPSEKKPYEAQASAAKDRYNQELKEYKKTESHMHYNQYLTEFKANQASQQGPASEGHKRMKRKLSSSSASRSDSKISSQHMSGSGYYSSVISHTNIISYFSTVIN